MACGLMRLSAETFGVLSCFSLNLAALGNFGFDAAAFGVMRRPAETLGVLSCFSLNLGPLGLGLMLGACVEDFFDGKKEFCEVGSRPPLDGRSQSFWNHKRIFTS